MKRGPLPMSGDLRASAWGFTLRGSRSVNEDAFLILDESHEVVRKRASGCLFAVADGLGGHPGGGVASRIAVDTLVEFFDTVRRRDSVLPLDRLDRLFALANERILERAEADPVLPGMGTTLTAAHSHGDSLYFAHAGDSRLMRVRGRRVSSLTDDHNVAHRILSEGRFDEEEYRTSPYRDSLLNYLGKSTVRVQKGAVDVRDGDLFILATDGFTSSLRQAEILQAAADAASPRIVAERLRDLAGSRRLRDNTTQITIQFETVLEPHV